jgi:pyruvate, water dikinase
MNTDYVIDLRELTASDVARVGGKDASLGEVINSLEPAGVNVPPGFATTADADWELLDHNHLKEPILAALNGLKTEKLSPERTSNTIRGLFGRAEFPLELAAAITDHAKLSAQVGRQQVDVPVRSSATAEDLPTATSPGHFA